MATQRFSVKVIDDHGNWNLKELHETAREAIAGARDANQHVRQYVGPGDFSAYYKAFDGDKPIEE